MSCIFLLAQVSQVSCSMYLPVMLVSPSFESLVNPATEETVAGVAVGSADGGPPGWEGLRACSRHGKSLLIGWRAGWGPDCHKWTPAIMA